ncbi:MAG: hypothetical protein HN509_10015 [Halobacteriovoraceae bacterium]|jgi:hypothetical protein|nr:hypothetical protein [Halobacteriovoraceae bacterium]MBT5096042.1 hypothetical protein [Halobacteriovoraceae bacterium]
MEKDFRTDYASGVRALEDLHTLGKSDLSPLISQVFFHFSEIRRKANSSVANLSSFKEISGYLEGVVEEKIHTFLLEQLTTKNLNLSMNKKVMGLKEWEKVLTFTDQVLKLITLFPIEKNLELSIGPDEVEIVGEVFDTKKLALHRQEVYAITRELFKQKVLLTFEVSEKASEDFYQLKLKFDYGHLEDEVYGIDLIREKNVFISFSNVFEKYKIDHREAAKLGDHYWIEIRDDLSVRQFIELPDNFLAENPTKEIIHFNFLFRPISLIIPKRGSLIFLDGFGQISTTGSDDSNVIGQDVFSHLQIKKHSIDIFSLFSS